MTSPEDVYLDLPGRAPGGGPLRLHYRDWGGRGTPLLLLHGLASGCRVWDLAAPHLVPTFRVLALDQRGHGLSDSPDSDYTFTEVTADLAAFISALSLERPVLAGHSWGAAVALAFAADRTAAASALVLVDGGFVETTSRPWEEAEKDMRPPEIDGMPVERFLSFAQNWPDFRELWSEQLKEMLLSNFQVSDGKIYRRLPVAKHMKIARALWEQRPSELWERLSCPVLLVPAMREPRDPREKRWLAAKAQGLDEARRRLPGVEVLEMRDTIHDVPVQRPRELARAIINFAAAAGRA